MKDQHKQITGYRDLSKAEIDAINKGKELAQKVFDHCNGLKTASETPGGADPDKRHLALAMTHLETGFMFLSKCIAKPTSGF